MFLLAAPPVFASRGLVLCSWVYVEGREDVSENWSLFLMQWSSLSLLLPLVWSHLSEIDSYSGFLPLSSAWQAQLSPPVPLIYVCLY